MNPDLKEKIIKKAVLLEPYGLHEFAWNRQDAENLINTIMHDPIGVLGGDVYELKSHSLRPLYENWFCEPKENESVTEFNLRSKKEALAYLNNFPLTETKKLLFSITFTDELS